MDLADILSEMEPYYWLFYLKIGELCCNPPLNSWLQCHTTNGPPQSVPGPIAAAMDGPFGPCTAATLG